MNKLLLLTFLFIYSNTFSQELFVFTEPASNMPAKALGFRDMNGFMFEKNGKLNYHNMPELMLGINKKFMFHVQGFISNRKDGGFETEGGSLYAKYRFFSEDGKQSHFRMALFGRISKNSAESHQDEIETMGHLIQNFNYCKKSLLKHRYLPNEDCYLDFKSNLVIINTYYI